MTPEPGVIKFLDSILHVLVTKELHDAGAILEGIRKANVARFTHVVFQILQSNERLFSNQNFDHICDRSILTTYKPIKVCES